jgi:hypothetical protein
MDTVRPKRRFAISLRAVLLLVLVVGLALGWKVNRARRQRDAVAAIRAEGGTVRYDWERISPPMERSSVPRTGPTVPVWIGRLAGDDLFQRADFVMVGGDASPHLKDLPGLRRLVVNDSLTDGQLADIGRLTSLRSLHLPWDAGITDAGLAELVGLKDLSELALMGMMIPEDSPGRMSDRGLEGLKDLPGLTHLFIINCPGITEEGVRKLKAARPNLVVYP